MYSYMLPVYSPEIERNRLMKTKGKFIIIEGVDGVGKSSILEKLIEDLDDPKVKHSKGFNRKGLWGRYINNHPTSIKYYLDIIVKSAFVIRPMLEQGDIVIQERYVQSVDTFHPDASYIHNRIFRRLTAGLFIKPDLYVNITASVDECVNRLKMTEYTNVADAILDKTEDNNFCKAADRRYHESLIADRKKIEDRMERYRSIYESHTGDKLCIDTTGRSVAESADMLLKELKVMGYVG